LALGASMLSPAWPKPNRRVSPAVQAIAEKHPDGARRLDQSHTGAEVRTGDSYAPASAPRPISNSPMASLIRLGQLSTLEVRGERDTRLAGGQLLFSFLKPGRILAGAGAAEIKGTAGIVSVDHDGNAQFVLYKGLLDVVTKLKTIELTPGSQVTVSAAGVLGNIGVAALLQYAGGQRFRTC